MRAAVPAQAADAAAREATLPVIELFHSVQGEGTHVGQPATFIRLAGCDLRCSWCDTPYSWSAEGLRDAQRMGLDELAARVRERGVVLTGGEPMLHAPRLRELVPLLREAGVEHVTVETNALHFDAELCPLVDLWSLSPKLPASGQRNDPSTIARFVEVAADRLQLKFVLAEPAADWHAMWQLIAAVDGAQRVPIIVQPDGLREDYADALRELTELVCADESVLGGAPRRSLVRVIPQTHRIAWGAHARGV